VLVAVSSYFVFKKSDALQQKVVDELLQRTRAEALLRQSEENLQITLNSIGDAVIATDCDGNIVRMNPVA
jgi:PAS domain-containing protein